MIIKILKKLVPLFVVIIVILLFCVVIINTDFRTTAKYRSYASFVESYKSGMEKQSVLDKFGHPVGYYDEQGIYNHIPNGEDEEIENTLFSSGCTAWIYECYRYKDPADPYRLQITFNTDGELLKAEFLVVLGG